LPACDNSKPAYEPGHACPSDIWRYYSRLSFVFIYYT